MTKTEKLKPYKKKLPEEEDLHIEYTKEIREKMKACVRAELKCRKMCLLDRAYLEWQIKEMDYWEQKERFAALSYKDRAKALKKILAKRYHKNVNFPKNIYCEHWLYANRENIDPELYEFMTALYEPKKSKYFKGEFYDIEALLEPYDHEKHE